MQFNLLFQNYIVSENKETDKKKKQTKRKERYTDKNNSYLFCECMPPKM